MVDCCAAEGWWWQSYHCTRLSSCFTGKQKNVYSVFNVTLVKWDYTDGRWGGKHDSHENQQVQKFWWWSRHSEPLPSHSSRVFATKTFDPAWPKSPATQRGLWHWLCHWLKNTSFPKLNLLVHAGFFKWTEVSKNKLTGHVCDRNTELLQRSTTAQPSPQVQWLAEPILRNKNKQTKKSSERTC